MISTELGSLLTSYHIHGWPSYTFNNFAKMLLSGVLSYGNITYAQQY